MAPTAPSVGLHDRSRPAAGAEFLAWKCCLDHSKALGREMLESAGLERTAAATVACRLQHLEREEREQDDRWPGEHGGREQKPG